MVALFNLGGLELLILGIVGLGTTVVVVAGGAFALGWMLGRGSGPQR